MPASKGGAPADADAPVGTPSGPWLWAWGVPLLSSQPVAKAAAKSPVEPPGEAATVVAAVAASTGMKVAPPPGTEGERGKEGRLR